MVYIAVDTLRHQPVGTGHVTVLQLRGPMAFRVLPWWLFLAGDTLCQHPMRTGHMTVLQSCGLMEFRALQWCHPMLASTRRTSCCTRMITLYGARKWIQARTDPNIYGMGAIPKRVHNINVGPSPAPPASFLYGNLGALASQGNLGALASQGNFGALASPGSPSTPFACQSQDPSEQLFSAPVTKKIDVDSPLVAIEKVANYAKFISRPVSDNEGTTLQLFLNEKLSRQAYKSNIMGPDTFFGVIAKNIPELAPMEPQKAANDLRKQLTCYIQENREFCEVSFIKYPFIPYKKCQKPQMCGIYNFKIH